MEDLITQLQSVDPLTVYGVIFAVALIENLFPPSPSDLLVVFGGALIAVSRIGFPEALIASSLGSALGFVLMYKVGDWFGERILEQGKLRFVSLEAVRKVEGWFRTYGYWIIVANRFLSGTRAVVSFFAGISGLNLLRTAVLSFVSAMVWNSILLGGGYYLGSNWSRLGFYLSTYSQVVTGILVIVVLVWAVRYMYSKKDNP